MGFSNSRTRYEGELIKVLIENMGEDCSTGVAFTRNPSTGENSFFGEFLINAQGEDVVAGTRTPQYITKKAKKDSGSKDPSMEEAMPKVYKELAKVFLKLERHYKDMQDIEFTVENNKLWMLQTRSGKRTAKAAIKIAVDMVKEKLISKKEAIKRIDPNTLDTLLHPTLDEKVEKEVIASGLPASPGAASGKVVFTADEAEQLKIQHGTAAPELTGMKEEITLNPHSMHQPLIITKREVGQILKERASELFRMIQFKLEEPHLVDIPLDRIVFTGGGAKLEGFLNIAKYIFQRN